MGKVVAYNKTTILELLEYCDKHDIIFLDNEYINNNTNHKWKCKKHDEIHTAKLVKIKRMNRLKCCYEANKRNLLIESVAKFCKDMNISLISEYTSCQKHLLWKCNTHNEVFSSTKHFLQNHSPLCCRNYKKLEEIKKHAAEFNVEFLEDYYKNDQMKYKWLCKKCNIVNITTFNILKTGSLPRCCHLKAVSGENSPKYNKDLSDEYRVKRRISPEVSKWRQAVIKRDNCTCQVCTITINDSKIVAHHIFSYIDNPDIRFDVSNGITLCVRCHINFHKIYGNGKNNVDQLNEFMNNK